MMFGSRLLILVTYCLSPVLANLISSIKALFTSSDPLVLLEADRTMMTSFITSIPAGVVATKKQQIIVNYEGQTKLYTMRKSNGLFANV